MTEIFAGILGALIGWCILAPALEISWQVKQWRRRKAEATRRLDDY